MRAKYGIGFIALVGLLAVLFNNSDFQVHAKAKNQAKAALVEEDSIEKGIVEDKHYKRLGKEVADNKLVQEFWAAHGDDNKTQVLEFFSYACQWCFHLDPLIEKWQAAQGDNIEFQRVPVEFQPSWTTLSKAYYTMQDLGVQDKVHKALFAAIEEDLIMDSSQTTLKNFFEKQGVDPAQFDEKFASLDITSKQKWANAISKAYQVIAVPSLVVQGPNGIYFTSVRLAGGRDELFKVLDYLVKLSQQTPPATTAE